MNYSEACNTLNFSTQQNDNIGGMITNLLKNYQIEKQKPTKEIDVLKEARDIILLPLVEEQTKNGKIHINPPFPGIACKDCNGTGKIWTFKKIKTSYVCKKCENKGFNFECSVCNNTGVITRETSTGRINKVLQCTTCKGEGTFEKKFFNPVISFNSMLKFKFQKK